MTQTLNDRWETKVRLAVARAKAEILADIANGTLPASIRDFTALHDFVDANEYGGLCEDGWVEYVADTTVEPDAEWTNESHTAACRVQDEVNDWLLAGRPTDAPGAFMARLTAVAAQFPGATVEWPGYLSIPAAADQTRWWAFGTANATWGGDLNECGGKGGEMPVRSVDTGIPSTEQDVEVIVAGIRAVIAGQAALDHRHRQSLKKA